MNGEEETKLGETSGEPDTTSQTGRQMNSDTSGEPDTTTWKEADTS